MLSNFNLFRYFSMILGYLGHATVIVSIDTYLPQDTNLFVQHWNKWLTTINNQNPNTNESYHHLLSVTTNNSLAQNETSNTITLKWTDLFKAEKGWNDLFATAPFDFSVTKVLFYIFEK